jgi:general secretion pathway protein L
MNDKILVKATSKSDTFEWGTLPERDSLETPKCQLGTLSELHSYIDDKPVQIIFLVPATSVLVKRVEFIPEERKHLLNTIPYMLEEEMVCDVTDMHVVVSTPQQKDVWVAAIKKDILASWLKKFADHNILVSYCFPEQYLLIDNFTDFSIYLHDDEYLVRYHDSPIYGVSKEHFDVALHIAIESYKTIPDEIDFYCEQLDDNKKKEILSSFPDDVQDKVLFHQLPRASMFNQFSTEHYGLNLLKKEFSLTKDFEDLFSKWKGLLILIVVAFSIHIGISYFSTFNIQNKTKLIVESNYEFCNQILSKCSKRKSVKKQLKKELQRVGGDASKGFLFLMSELSSVLKNMKDYTLISVSFSGSGGVLDIIILVDDFSKLDVLQNKLKDKNLKVTLNNSNSENNQVRARLSLMSQI